MESRNTHRPRRAEGIAMRCGTCRKEVISLHATPWAKSITEWQCDACALEYALGERDAARAELDALKARRCNQCEHHLECIGHWRKTSLLMPHDYNCSSWKMRNEKP